MLEVEQILLAGNRGPCGGVNMSLQATREVLAIVSGRERVYTNNEIVHNVPVMEELYGQGLVNFENDWDKVEDNSVVLFSEHGVSPRMHEIAQAKNCLTIDVTCQLVTRQHTLVKKAAADGLDVIYAGVDGHPETMGVMGEIPDDKLTLVQNIEEARKVIVPDTQQAVLYSQTTLSTFEIREIQEEMRGRSNVAVPNRWDICYATDNRQAAVDELLPFVDFVIVVGSRKSHNSQMLKERASQKVKAYSIDRPDEIDIDWFVDGIRRVGLTSGASVEERFFVDTLEWFKLKNPNIQIKQMPEVKAEPVKIFALPQKDINLLKARYGEAA